MVAMGQLNILVAEDDELNRQLISEIIKKLGHHCLAVKNGAEAVACYGQRHFDMVLLDLQMPVLGGSEALLAMRGMDDTRGLHTPIAVLSGEAQVVATENERLSKFDAYLGKPFTPGQVARLIESFFPTDREFASEAIKQLGQENERESLDEDRGLLIEEDRMEAALEKTHGDLLFFETLLKKFERKFQEVLQSVASAIKMHEDVEALHLLHGLKGELTIFNADEALHLLRLIEIAIKNAEMSQAELEAGLFDLEEEIRSMIMNYKALLKRKHQN